MVFILSSQGSQLPAELKEPLLYVQLFKIAAPPEAELHIGMYQVRHSFYSAPNGSPSRRRIGKIVWLIDVTHAVELIPIYGTTMDHSVSSTMSLECYGKFDLNAFSDKEWYHTLHADFVQLYHIFWRSHVLYLQSSILSLGMIISYDLIT